MQIYIITELMWLYYVYIYIYLIIIHFYKNELQKQQYIDDEFP